MALIRGQKIDRFTILELLGEGGMGTVYAVRDPQRPEEALALKVLRTDMAASAELRERFAREAKTVGGLYKRGIVWALEADAHGSPAWLLMERVAGLPLPDGRRALSLAELRKAYGDALPEREIARLLDLCLDGLYAAHATGVVHRDLKPENILLDPGGEADPAKALEKAEPKIADFGLVALREAEGGQDQAATLQPQPALTMQGQRAGREGALLGTWDFMAPEQKKGQPADKRSDTYAMTLIAFWLLTGQNLGVSRASELRPSLAPAWDAFLERGYAPDPSARYQDAAEMRQALQPVIRALADPEKRARDVAEEKRREGERDLAETRRTRGVGYWVFGVAVVLAGASWAYRHHVSRPHVQEAPSAVAQPYPATAIGAVVTVQPETRTWPLPGIFVGRPGGKNGHRSSYKAYGGFTTSEGDLVDDTVLRALRWLKQNQQADGSWPKNGTAMTGMAVLAFLGYGLTTDSPEFGQTLQRGIEFLLRSQDTNGVFAGSYHHPIATYALCEAAAITRDPNVRAAAERAVAVIIGGQHPSGGFDYRMLQSSRDDTSVMGWCAQALEAARIAQLKVAGLDQACALAVRGFLKNASPDGGFGYTGPGREGLSAVGTLCLQMLTPVKLPEVARTLTLMDDWVCDWNKPVVPGLNPQYYFYYATQAKFRDGGARWTAWNRAMWRTYVENQKVREQAIPDAAGKMQAVGWWENGDQATDRPVMDTCLAALQLMVYYRYSLASDSHPGPEPAAMPAPQPDLQAGQPWTNSLGMVFVPVPGTAVRFSIWDTRVQDFEQFVKATGYNIGDMRSEHRGGFEMWGDTWRSPGFQQGPTHPVSGVNWEDAKAFCQWLTDKDRAEGRLVEGHAYRLPTDEEWSVAVGLDQESGSTPREKSGAVKNVYAWGTKWPPPKGAGNFAGIESKTADVPDDWHFLQGYDDGFARTSPVGSFAANRFGLYDMGGNLWQWCEDWYDNEQKERVLRGQSWVDGYWGLSSSCRDKRPPTWRLGCDGFRCVLAGGSMSAPEVQSGATRAVDLPTTTAISSDATSWIIPTVPKAGKDGWVTLFDGEHLYGCNPADPQFTSGQVYFKDGYLCVNDAWFSFDWKGQNVTVRARVKKINGRHVALHIGPCFAWYGNGFGISQNVSGRDQAPILISRKLMSRTTGFVDLELSMTGRQLEFKFNGAVVLTKQALPFEHNETSVQVSTWKGLSQFERVEAKVLGE